jgi:hypothetical protein
MPLTFMAVPDPAAGAPVGTLSSVGADARANDEDRSRPIVG